MTKTIHIDAVAHGGHGVGRIEGQVCFVPYALPGDTVRVDIVRTSKRVLWGQVEEIIEPSPDRVEAPCPPFGNCGGCTWLHFAYPAQGEWKRRIVQDCFERIARLSVEPEWIEDEDYRLAYRTRAEFHCVRGKCGFYARQSHEIVDIAGCPLCHPKLNDALGRVRRSGYLGAVEVTVNPESDQVLVWTKRPHRKLKRLFPLAGAADAYGKPARFVLDGVPVVNGAFTQASLLLNRLLRTTVYEMAAGAESVLDLYCGSGNLSLGLAARARVVGIDRSQAAIRAAWGMKAGDYRVGDEEGFRSALRSQHWDAVILDPPRTGARAAIPALSKAKADKLVYVSCDPATQARDVAELVKSGWQVKRLVVLDLYPNTSHVETVCRLTR